MPANEINICNILVYYKVRACVCVCALSNMNRSVHIFHSEQEVPVASKHKAFIRFLLAQ